MTYSDLKTCEVADSQPIPTPPVLDLLDLELAYVGGGIGNTVL